MASERRTAGITIRTFPSIRDKLQAAADAEERSISFIVERIIKAALEAQEREDSTIRDRNQKRRS